MQCSRLESFHRLGQSLLFKVVQWKAQYKIIPKLFLPLPFLFLVNSDSQILVLGFRGHLGLIPGLKRFPGERNGNPLQYSWLENSIDRGDLEATIHGVAKSQTGLSDWAPQGPYSQLPVKHSLHNIWLHGIRATFLFNTEIKILVAIKI